ncbi:MAG: acyl-CoA-binding protein [Rhodanobacteraceae bacterium]
MSNELDGDFRQATEDVKRLPERPDNDTLLKLYALYKQATAGDANGPKPGFFDFVNTAKHEAWTRLRGMRTDEAQQKYIELVRQLGA